MTDPERHLISIFRAGDFWGWGCSCGESDGTNETRALATQGADWHRVHGVAGMDDDTDYTPPPSWWCQRCGEEVEDCTCGARQRPVLS
jgi:hypothetical protein